jgi:hypothetical protein
MDAFAGALGMVPYPLIFPDAREGVVGLNLPRKVGKAKAGEYSFVEAYCVEEDCDCGRTAILVIDAKGKKAATIEFGFDPDDPLAGPFLDEYEKQSAGAPDLLQIFVEAINDNPDWLKGMHRRYKQVRKKVDGRAYRGKAFPKPGSVERVIKPPEEGENPLADFQRLLEAAVRTPPVGGRKRKAATESQGTLFPDQVPAPRGMSGWAERYLGDDSFETHGTRQTELRAYLLAHDRAGNDLAELLVTLFEIGHVEERLDAALRLLADVFEILRVELERRRPDAMLRMERWQAALARHVYAENVEPHLGAMVTQVMLNARVEILPLLHEANSRRMLAGLEGDPDFPADPEKAMLDLLEELEEQGADNPHELFEALLQMMAVGDAEVQVNLCRLMLEMEHPVVREAAMLMLFHPQSEVRSGVAQVLAEVAGERVTPAALRRLIVSRNWFPEGLRGQIDQAIANARRARVECAPLPKRVEMTVYASAVDGAMAQTFQVIVPDGKGFLCCSIMPKKGSGVADAFLIPFAGKRERNEFLSVLKGQVGALESTPDYLDRRICQALADGANQGKVPCHWLVAIAERLGRDQWRASPLDVPADLAALRAELERGGGRFATERYRPQALEASRDWPDSEAFARSWFEDDAEVDEVVTKIMKSRRRNKDSLAIDAIFAEILEPRRQQWLERLVLTALWLKSAKKPPVPWERMAHVALSVGDENLPLERVPLLETIADISIVACEQRREG